MQDKCGTYGFYLIIVLSYVGLIFSTLLISDFRTINRMPNTVCVYQGGLIETTNGVCATAAVPVWSGGVNMTLLFPPSPSGARCSKSATRDRFIERTTKVGVTFSCRDGYLEPNGDIIGLVILLIVSLPLVLVTLYIAVLACLGVCCWSTPEVVIPPMPETRVAIDM